MRARSGRRTIVCLSTYKPCITINAQLERRISYNSCLPNCVSFPISANSAEESSPSLSTSSSANIVEEFSHSSVLTLKMLILNILLRCPPTHAYVPDCSQNQTAVPKQLYTPTSTLYSYFDYYYVRIRTDLARPYIAPTGSTRTSAHRVAQVAHRRECTQVQPSGARLLRTLAAMCGT
jgi:hypothetical protein